MQVVCGLCASRAGCVWAVRGPCVDCVQAVLRVCAGCLGCVTVEGKLCACFVRADAVRAVCGLRLGGYASGVRAARGLCAGLCGL